MAAKDRSIFRKELFLWLGFLTFTLVMYNNCSQQKFRFTPTEEALRVELNTNGGIVIEGGREFTNNRNVNLTIFSDPGNKMYVTNDSQCNTGGEWEEYTEFKSWKLSRANQDVSVYVRFQDTDGVMSDCLSDSIIHDSIPPTLTFKEAPAAVGNSSLAKFTLQAYDNLSQVERILCATDAAGPFTECLDSLNSYQRTLAKGADEGQQVQYFQVQDRARNMTQPIPYSWIYDATAPTVELVKMPALVTSFTDAYFEIVGKDQHSKISEYECAFGSNSFVPCAGGKYTIPQVPIGTNVAKFRVKDEAGNVSDVLTYQWTVDTTKPAVKITSGPVTPYTPYTQSQEARFTFVGESQRPGITIADYLCSLDGANYTSCASGETFRNISEGEHTFYVIAQDSEGLQSAPATQKWTVDRTPPTVQITSKPKSLTNEKQASFSYVASDTGSGLAGRSCQIDGQAVACETGHASQDNLAEGDHTFTVTVTDQAGNSASASYNWHVDLTPPALIITSGPDRLTQRSDATFLFRGQDNKEFDETSYECRINQLPYQSCSSGDTFAGLTEGKNIFTVTGKDQAGNLAQPESYEWTIDVTGPKIVFEVQPTDHSEEESSQVRFRVTDDLSDVSQVRCGLNGALTVCNPQSSYTLSGLTQGAQSYRVEAQDSLGNSSFAVVTWNVTRSFERKTQVIPVVNNNKVDILFVVDNSGSMSPIQNQLSNRIDGFVDKIAHLDWQIMLTTTDPRDRASWGDGKLRPMVGSQTILTRNASNPMQALKNAINVGASGSGDERGINATRRFLERNHSGAVRPGAAFTAIVISDEDECSNGCNFNNNSNAKSSPDELIAYMNDRYQDKLFVFNALVALPGDRCTQYVTAGNTYMRLQGRTNGILGSVCSTDYSSELSALGDKVASLVRSVQLECAPVDTNGDGRPDVKVTLEAGQTPPSHQVDGTLVSFASALPTGQHLFEYSCKK